MTGTGECLTGWAGPRYVGSLGRLIICCPLKLIFFDLSRAGQGWQASFEGACPNCS